jgi:hypothetical protein
MHMQLTFTIITYSYTISYLYMVIIKISIHDHKSAYLSQMVHTTGYVCEPFLLTIGSLSCRYSLKEATPELGMSFLHQGREHRLYLTNTYTMGFYAKPNSIGFIGVRTCYTRYHHPLVDFHAKATSVEFIGIQNATPVHSWIF